MKEVLYDCVNEGLDGEEQVGCEQVHEDYSLQVVVHV